jgi:ATP-binding cassette subfamily F protein 3
VGYFAQHQLEQLEDRASPLEHLQRQDRHASEQQLRDYLGGFGFAGDRAEAQVAPFSGGEKARLVLALIVRARPNLLLLDEPTNHLDLDMRLALSTALQDFQGAMVVVSHDRHLLRTVTDRFLLVADGRVEPFDGDLEDYRARVQEERQRSTTGTGGGGALGVAGRLRRQAAAEKRRRQQPLRNRVVRLEKKMEALAAESTVLEQRLSDTDLYQPGRQAELTDLLKQRAELDRRLQVVESEWLTASEALEDS